MNKLLYLKFVFMTFVKLQYIRNEVITSNFSEIPQSHSTTCTLLIVLELSRTPIANSWFLWRDRGPLTIRLLLLLFTIPFQQDPSGARIVLELLLKIGWLENQRNLPAFKLLFDSLSWNSRSGSYWKIWKRGHKWGQKPLKSEMFCVQFLKVKHSFHTSHLFAFHAFKWMLQRKWYCIKYKGNCS